MSCDDQLAVLCSKAAHPLICFLIANCLLIQSAGCHGNIRHLSTHPLPLLEFSLYEVALAANDHVLCSGEEDLVSSPHHIGLGDGKLSHSVRGSSGPIAMLGGTEDGCSLWGGEGDDAMLAIQVAFSVVLWHTAIKSPLAINQCTKGKLIIHTLHYSLLNLIVQQVKA